MADICDACAGTGKPTSGRPCMCGGSGKMSDAAIYLREQLFDRDRRIEALTKVLAKLEFGVKTDGVGVGFCPWCGSDEPGPHEPDCELRKALASAAGAETKENR